MVDMVGCVWGDWVGGRMGGKMGEGRRKKEEKGTGGNNSPQTPLAETGAK